MRMFKLFSHGRYNKFMEDFSFDVHRKDIVRKINELLKKEKITDPDGFTVIDGFVSPTIKTTIKQFMDTDGEAFPMVAVVANSTGRVYQYSAKSLFPDIEVL